MAPTVEVTGAMKSILVAACDLDKTLYPPRGPGHAAQLKANVRAMLGFEASGGFVFPVTGNNLLLAQCKFMDPEDPERQLRDLRVHPGIYNNGALVLGPQGKELERHPLGLLARGGEAGATDFVTSLLDFCDDERVRASVLKDVGLCLFTPNWIGGYEAAYANVDGYAQSQNVTARRLSREECRAAGPETLLITLLFRPVTAGKEGQAAMDEYRELIYPQQLRVQEAMRDFGLMGFSSPAGAANGVGDGIKVTIMKDPWPEMDLNVAGVDKGQALSRFLKHPDVLGYLRQDCIRAEEQLAVFGDAPNDVPMFEAVGGVQAALRVAMPHALDPALTELSNVRAEVSEVLDAVVEAKKAA